MLNKRAKIALGLVVWFGVLGALMWHDASFPPPSGDTNKQTDKSPKQEVDSRTPDERLADYTLWLERFTGLLALVSSVQIIFLIRSDQTARAAANAATSIGERQLSLTALQTDISEKQKEIDRLHYFGANRPRLEIKFVKPVTRDSNNQYPVTVSLSVINTGTSEAVMTGSRVALAWMREAEIPDPNDLPGEEIVKPRPFKAGTTDRTVIKAKGTNMGGMNLYLMGWIVYFDARGQEFGDSHTTYFLRQWTGYRFEVAKSFPDWDFLF